MNNIRQYRGLRLDGKGWAVGHYTEGSPDHHYITNPVGSVWQVDPKTVGQFTGKDSTCEGDICEATFKDKDGVHTKRGVVVMDDYMWCLDTMDEADEHGMYSLNRLTIVSIAGNIHESQTP